MKRIVFLLMMALPAVALAEVAAEMDTVITADATYQARLGCYGVPWIEAMSNGTASISFIRYSLSSIGATCTATANDTIGPFYLRDSVPRRFAFAYSYGYQVRDVIVDVTTATEVILTKPKQ